MRMIIEACEDQRRFLSILVTHNSSERLETNIFQVNIAADVENERLRNRRKNSSQYFWRNPSLKTQLSPGYEFIRPSGYFNSTI